MKSKEAAAIIGAHTEAGEKVLPAEAVVNVSFAIEAIQAAEIDMRTAAIKAFRGACPLTPSKENFCGVVACGDCDAVKNFIRKLEEE